MFEHMTADRTANAIMQDSTFKGTNLVVEGTKDYKFYSKFFNIENTVQIKQVGGKEKVREVIELLNARNFNEKIGIIDSDFSKILSDEVNTENVFLTDFHDIEVMMFGSPALETTLNIYTTNEKIEKFLDGRKLRGIILDLAKQIGFLKLANHIYKLGLAFKPRQPQGKPLKYKDFIDNRTLDFKGNEQLITTVHNYSINRSDKVIDAKIVEEKVKELVDDKYDLLHLVNGHDLSNILFFLLKKVLRSPNMSLYDIHSIEDSLIMSYEARFWIDTELFKKIYDWGLSNNQTLFKEDIEHLYNKLRLEV
ncbi:DUF4435 domain-containing protein [Anaerobacillus sp. 1_MG-2023]|uniref:DUF4435 domain-containing protein n=1 Tax=Anaerobacillus sp. 1_MG-2023 TaxID=3062655 RepID=UPI0026E32F71|nr:DUF4435 domain-containing protein [Anaerobacillus sp. 1_MG-2023]MDO6654511.1 DUF4435 domain-containing protein [Anaerobacillus sp. 1_MG-2023]